MTGTGRSDRRLAVAVARIAGSVALAGLITACGTVESAVPAPAGGQGGNVAVATRSHETITETGSTLLYPLARTWAAAYRKRFPGVTMTTAPTGSGAGIAAASSGHADIGASDAYLSSGDLVKNPALRNIPLAISAQVVLYHLPGLGGDSHLKLNGAVLAQIYDGQVTKWDDKAITSLNPGLRLPPIAIVPVRRSDSSGDTFLFTSYLSTQDAAWNNNIGYGTVIQWPGAAARHAAKGNSGVVRTCAATRGCIAYAGISYLSQALSDGLGYAALANAAGHYEFPTAVAIRAAASAFVPLMPPGETMSMIDGPSATGYPIINYEYAVVSTRQPNAAKASAIRAFLRWAIGPGNSPSYLNTVGFQPLPAAVAGLGERQIAEIGS